MDQGRRPYLDGLRGVAALIVLIGHTLITFFSPVVTLQNGPDWMLAIGASPLGLLWNGNSAVCVFFVLSGFVMAQMTERSDQGIIALSIRRYIRLALPILITSTLAYLLLRFGLYRNLKAGQITESGWLTMWYQFAPSGRSMIEESLWGTFLNGSAAYNSNLWTMNPELSGSLWIIGIWALAKNRILRLILLGLFAAWNIADYRILFAVGAALFEFQGEIQRARPISWPLLIAGAYLCGLTNSATTAIAWYPGLDRVFTGNDWPRYWHEIGAAALVLGLLANTSVQRMFSAPAPQFLGRISFTLYLIHLPLICGPISWLVLVMSSTPHTVIRLIGPLLTIIICIVAAAAATRFVDVWPTRISRKVGDRLSTLLARPAVQWSSDDHSPTTITRPHRRQEVGDQAAV